MDGRRSLGQLFVGLLVVVAGVVLLLDRAGAVDVSFGALVGTLWPVVVVLVGVASLVVVPRAWYGPAVVTAVGVVLLLDRLDVLDVNVWDYLWPVAVILVGLGITFAGAARSEQDRVTALAFWWGTERRPRTQRFRSASLTAVMGGVELDLRDAGIEGSARVDVFTFWGGVEIKVPHGWQVRTWGLPLMGGWDDRTEEPAGPAPVLEVRLVTVMGGAEVHHGKRPRTVQDAPVDAPTDA